MTERVDIVDMLTKGRGKWGDGETHEAKMEWTAEEIEKFTPRPSDAQLEELHNRPVDDKWVKNPKELDPDYYKKFAVEA